MESSIFDTSTMTWVVIPVLIFLARIVDVTIYTAAEAHWFCSYFVGMETVS